MNSNGNVFPQATQRQIEGKDLLVRYQGNSSVEGIISQPGCFYADTLARKRSPQQYIARFRGYPQQGRGFNLEPFTVGEIIKCAPYQEGNLPFWLILDVKNYTPVGNRKFEDPRIKKINEEQIIFEAYGIAANPFNMWLRGAALSMEELKRMDKALAEVLEPEDRFFEFVFKRSRRVCPR